MAVQVSCSSNYVDLHTLMYVLELGADIYDNGFVNVTNIDISTVVINKMSDLYADREEMECESFEFT